MPWRDVSLDRSPRIVNVYASQDRRAAVMVNFKTKGGGQKGGEKRKARRSRACHQPAIDTNQRSARSKGGGVAERLRVEHVEEGGLEAQGPVCGGGKLRGQR